MLRPFIVSWSAVCPVVRVEVVARRATLVGRAAVLVDVKTVFIRVVETAQTDLDLRRSAQQLNSPDVRNHS